MRLCDQDRSLSSVAKAIGKVGKKVEHWENVLSSSRTTKRAKAGAEARLKKLLPVLSALTKKSLDQNLIPHRIFNGAALLSGDHHSFPLNWYRVKRPFLRFHE